MAERDWAEERAREMLRDSFPGDPSALDFCEDIKLLASNLLHELNMALSEPDQSAQLRNRD